MKKYVLSVENPQGDKKFVYSDSNLDEIRHYIEMKYHGAKKIYPKTDELFKDKVIDKYSYILHRTFDIQDQFILRISIVDLKDDYEEEVENV